MMSYGPSDPHDEPTGALRYISKEEAIAMETELLTDYRFGQQQLTEVLGHACAIGVAKAFPLGSLEKRQPTVLVICGPEHNGCVGLSCARYLRLFDYLPTVFYPKRSQQAVLQAFTVQCEKMDIPFLSYLPAEVQLINDAYNLVVDAVVGTQTEPASLAEPFTSILVTLRNLSVPIVSLDIPSGWDDSSSDTDRINPAVLISLMAPKACSLGFQGTHFLAGRFLPYDLQKKYELCLPEYPGTDCLVQLTDTPT
ncbi:yjeF N-terminal domain-containing 3-like [Alosa sapidissima]|uniref:yjeF N-terminal domain-containing 3-like n=1 Tax=Alosa sapidissima TaxID=34773 RepID=UPI001C0847B3|nr:yjeF N-terminal domain-containing 3-like [Alosa sapidissima]XP_041923336.1 yjeF N-terminal domain-containing 3-like [Alosa sapidissima]